MADLDQTDFDKLDRDALQRSLELALAETDDPDMVANLRDTLRTEGWWKAASIASHRRQYAHLNLMPWQSAPSEIDIEAILARGPNDHRDFGAAKLLKKMIAHGLSRFDHRQSIHSNEIVSTPTLPEYSDPGDIDPSLLG